MHSYPRLLSILLCFAAIWGRLAHQVNADTPRQERINLIALLEVITADVEWLADGASEEDWQRVSGRIPVQAGDRIRTDANGTAMLIWFADGTLVELVPNTEILITEFSSINPDQFVVEYSVVLGRVFNSVNRLINPESRYQVKTPNLQISVRGTVFGVDVPVQDQTTLLVREGTVKARKGEFEHTVPAGTWVISQADIPLVEATSLELPTTVIPENVAIFDTEVRDFLDRTSTTPFEAVVVAIDGARVRANPTLDATVLNAYPFGTPMLVVARTAEEAWLQVLLPDGTIGWVFAELLRVYLDLNELPIIPTD